jgi:hypothetical protein
LGALPKSKGKGKAKQDPNALPSWVVMLFQELQEVRENQTQFQERFQEVERRTISQRATQSKSQSREHTVRERFC